MLRLCSTSKVRQEILKKLGVPFIVGESDFNEEQLKIKSPRMFAYQATLGKHKKALEKYGLELPLLIADSVVSCNGALQRKARSVKEARDFLCLQSGGTLSVISCAILHSQAFYCLDISVTHFTLDFFNQKDIEDYLSSDVWQNKAGAVMIEGFHKKYIKTQIGTTYNAMGLNIEALLPFLRNRI